MYETFDHTADIGLRITAGNLPELFAEAGRALASLIVANLADVQPVEERLITVVGEEKDYLFFDWLNELLYMLDHERLVFSEIDVVFTTTGLTAHCRGEKLDASRHRLEHEVKAITYHGLIVEQTDEGWLAEVILDI